MVIDRNEIYVNVTNSIEKFINICLKYKVIYGMETIEIAMLYFHKINVNKFLLQYSTYYIFVVCMIIASKNLEDSSYDNRTFSKLSNLNLQNINHLECEFLKAFDFNITLIRDKNDLMNEVKLLL